LAANTALDFASHELFCLTDADTYPERDSLLRSAVAFTESPDVVGVGGTLRIANGGKVRDHHVSRGLFPGSFLARMQIVEYIRSFYCGRAGSEERGAVGSRRL
jgi:cellulose synthase/poly-beta-1,6-N-acetylglucosamine synthase-like glycosyltransferase